MTEPGTVTIVLVHGAFAESLSNWKPDLELLLAKGYKVVAAPNPLRSVSSDAAYVSSILNTIDGPAQARSRPARRAARYSLDGAEHGASIKRVCGTAHSSSSARSCRPGPAPPRRCGQACWRARSRARCGAGVSWPPRSSS